MHRVSVPSYSSSSQSSSELTMFIRHNTSVAMFWVLAERSSPGIWSCAGIILIAFGCNNNKFLSKFYEFKTPNINDNFYTLLSIKYSYLFYSILFYHIISYFTLSYFVLFYSVTVKNTAAKICLVIAKFLLF